MDIEDPIQQLLKTTGWSCDDLLKKLQRYKCQKESNKEETTNPVDKLSEDPKICVVNSTDETNDHDLQIPNLETKKKVAQKTEAHNEKTDHVSNSCTVNEEFSDTDEEETEVNVTNTNIINEIIDEIMTGETEGSLDKNDNDYHMEIDEDHETTEVMEVRVIQVSTDDEDDDVDDLFTDEGCQDKRNSSCETLNSDKFEYLETYPRNSDSGTNQSVLKKLNCNEEIKVDERDSFAFSQDTNENQTPINGKKSNKDYKVVPNECDKSITNIDGICSETKLTTEEKADENKIEDVEKVFSSKKLESLQDINILQKSPSRECKVAESITDKTDPLDVEENIPNGTKETREECVSKNLEKTKNNPKLQLNKLDTQELETATEKEIDNSNLGIIINNNNESTLQNVGVVQNNMTLQINSVNYEVKLFTDKEIDSQCLDTDGDNESHDIEEQSKNLEEIRNNLKLQLNSLRTRKKGHFLQDLRSNVANVDYSQLTSVHNVDNKSRKAEQDLRNNFANVDHSKNIVNNCNKSQTTSVLQVDKSNKAEDGGLVCEKSNDNVESDNLDNKLYTQTNEFGLVILNVQGGVDIDEIEGKSCENHSPEGDLNENSSCTSNSVLETAAIFNESNSCMEADKTEIEPSNGVFDEIRKIIRKQKGNTFKKNKKTEVIWDSKVDKPNTDIDTFSFFSNSAEPETGEEKIGNHGKRSMDMSADNSSSSFTVDDTNQAVDKNSPFVSNTLDEFLTGESKLNISYNVPKCGAEEGLSENYHDESPLLLKKIIKVTKEQSPKPKKIKTLKAKTLAQKRKMLEKQRRKQMKNEKLTSEQPDPTIVKTESTEKSQENNVSFVLVNDKKIWVKSIRPASCIAKINTTIAPVVTKETKINQPQRKLSLLTDLEKKIKGQVKYRPGPMCKKANLQISGQDSWKTEMKTLPKIFLEVTPKIGTPILPYIVRKLPQCDGKLTASRVEFALSVLKTKAESDVKQKTFKFPLAYKGNQDKVIVRKQKISPIKCASTKSSNEEKSVGDVVADVIDDLITYVEIKELAPTLIKEEERERDTIADEEFAKMPVIAANVSSIFKKPQKKRSKIDLELFRLSCKVVNVEVEENLSREICYKPHCKLGCLCNSLKCDRILTYHCGKVQCMLDCSCPKERVLVYDKVTLPAGTDILSTDAVNRIEDEAKKDLAKVERDFTQTVIHTNDKTIVVGLGGRNKCKRTTKAPKKYCDYFDSIESIKEEEKEKDVNKNDFLRKCVVSLENLNLSSIIPFCLTHNLYNCHCEGKSLYQKDDTLSKSNPIVIKDNEEALKKKQTHNPLKYNRTKLKRINRFYSNNTKKSSLNTPTEGPESPHNENIDDMIEKKQTTNLRNYNSGKTPELKIAEEEEKKQATDSGTQIEEEGTKLTKNKTSTPKKPYKMKIKLQKPKVPIESHNESDISPIEKNGSSGRPIRNIKKVKLKEDFSYPYHLPEDCARVRGISATALKHCRRRNKNKTHFQKYDFINNISQADLLKSKINFHYDTRQMLEVDLLKKHLIDESNRQKNATLLFSDKNNHKRKQTLEIRSDENGAKISFNQAIQRRKKAPFVNQKSTRIEPVFDGEIIIDCRNMELLEKMGARTVSDGYARLLPWKALTDSYRDGTIKIWSMVDTPSRLLINKSDKLPPKNYINITQVPKTTEVITWILQNKLPSTYHEDHVSFILKQTKDHYEICGLCTKNFNDDVFTKDTPDTSPETNSVLEQPEEGLTVFPHKDLNGVSQTLFIQKGTFKLQELIEENLAAVGETSIDKNRLYMWAALPEVSRVGKWRIIFLNSDFTYLYFNKLKYSIKYTDLIGVGNMAKTGNCTVMLRNPLIQQSYRHERFGIYFDSHYQDRLFIGPYLKEFSGGDIETLRYINKSLVCNESFHKMIGNMDYKCGHWLIERPYGRTKRQPEQTIDLTHDSCQAMGKRKNDSDTKENAKKFKIETYTGKERVVILHNKEQIKVIDGVPRKPEDFNRYMITNIPYFGYLGAYKHKTSNEIDISWPFENKLLRFSTVHSAIDFLQERFSSLLQPIPETFKINVIVLTQIDLKNSQPVDAKVLSGHYICGDFGFYNVKTISNELCLSAVGMTREELLRIFAKRAQTFVKNKIEELAALLNIEKSELGRYDIINILHLAQKEIDQLKEMEKNYLAKKNELALHKRDLALKLFHMIPALPEKQQRWEHLKFRKILGKNSPNLLNDKTEPIVIPDSDEEDVSNNASEDLIRGEPPEIFGKSSSELNSSLLHSALVSAPETEKVRSPVGPAMVSILCNKNIAPKVTETALSLQPPLKKLKLKSVLKPISKSCITALSSVKPPSLPSTESSGADPTENDAQQKVPLCKCTKPQYLTGVKIVKTSSGKFVLVSDKDDSKPFRLPEVIKGTKIIIKNSKILSVKKIDGDDNTREEEPASECISKEADATSTQGGSSTNENFTEIGSVLDTARSDNDASPPCLEENKSVEQSIAAESEEKLNDSVNSVETISEKVTDDPLSVTDDKCSEDNDSPPEIGAKT